MRIRFSPIVGMALVIELILCTGSLAGQDVEAKQREWFFGFSYDLYSLTPESHVFFTSDSPTQEAAGFRLSTVNNSAAKVACLVDIELQVGNTERWFPWRKRVEEACPMVGAQMFIGSRLRIGSSKFSLHAMGGLSTLHISGADGEYCGGGGSGNVVIFYNGSDPATQAWVNWFNNEREEDPDFIPGFPSYSRTAPALNFGIEFDLGFGSESNSVKGFRFQIEYIPLYDHGLSHNMRLDIGWVFR